MLDGERVALAANAKSIGVAIRDVRASMADLNAINDGVWALQAQGVQDADLIYSTVPDYESDRLVIRVSAASTGLFAELARRYGIDAIAVWIDPNGRGGSTMSRDSDISPYWGGAKIGTPKYTCSDSFAWEIGTTSGNALLTAAHCIPVGGNVSIGSSTTTVRGTVASHTEENWDTTLGSQYYTGQSTYRGDVALIRLTSSYSSTPQIYRGGPTSVSHSSVVTVLRRYSWADENVFAGGERKGETGPYHISMVGTSWRYTADGPSVVVRNIVIAPLLFSTDPFLDHGDSGGSVFRENSSGNIIAVGTISGIAGTSSLVFTDIYNSYLSLPGDIDL